MSVNINANMEKHVKMPKPTKLMKNITSKNWAGAGCVKKTSCMFHEGSADLRLYGYSFMLHRQKLFLVERKGKQNRGASGCLELQ
jgi:hypothetical protein